MDRILKSNLTQQEEIGLVMEERKREFKKWLREKQNEKKLEIRRDHKIQSKKWDAYYQARFKGKTTQKEIFWGIKDDFYQYSFNMGGYMAKVANKLKVYTDEYERKWNETQAAEAEILAKEASLKTQQEDGEKSQDDMDFEDDDLDMDLGLS